MQLTFRHPVKHSASVLAGRRRHFQLGATLIEALVSIVIASLGLLALAGINASATRYSKMSQFRATATLLASDITERMRANRSATTATNYAFSTTSFVDQASVGSQPTPSCEAATDTCTEAQIAAADLWRWRQAVRESLPNGSVFLAADATTPNVIDLWLAWRDPAVEATDEVVRAGGALECPNDLAVTDDPTVRCIFFRVTL
jgi:type IV pilus assembly protein PilV